ncbi:MAG: ABC transporter substrate-binding protein [Flexistipes sinusarabici]|uniref:ABC transporter substrate-binding protein n=1 Tax=Flexistipes sinusarabici TaxID=2352 RepID=A0A5D0MNR8_FLESI|nr:TRAP transporter substrate-binding protein DctP [Flexistipes sinusarabici]TYB34052.1 MAG: ABC transporter substrate-binding protein [Flexistipes sinusarabici]
MKKLALILSIAFMLSTAITTFAAEKKTYNWRLVTTWSTSIPFYETAQHFAETVDKLSEGQLKIKVYPAGAIVPAFQIFDAVRNGVAQMGHDWPGYWKGKEEAFVAFASVPFGMNSIEYSMWLQHEGMDLAREVYGKFGLVPLMGGNPGQEIGFYTKKPVNSVAEMGKMKIRTVGWAADILEKMGVSISPVPGGETYLALERGVVDGAEFSTPSATYPLGFQEVAKNVIVPGWYQTSCQNMFMVNEKAYNELPDHLKYILEIASRETQWWSMAEREYENAVAIVNYKKEGVSFNKLDDESLNKLRETTKNYLDSLRKKDALLDKVLTSQEDLIQLYSNWKKVKSGVSAYPYEDYINGMHLE